MKGNATGHVKGHVKDNLMRHRRCLLSDNVKVHLTGQVIGPDTDHVRGNMTRHFTGYMKGNLAGNVKAL